jgi:L-ascorbate metabolism protein UlaG (beta-lactamase superfamily)
LLEPDFAMSSSLTWLGHATWLLETAGLKVLVDPFLDGNPSAKLRATDVAADFFLITHGHGDHIADAVPIASRTGATVIAAFEICEWLSARGVSKSHPMNIGGSHRFPFGKVQVTIAHHSSTLPDGASGGAPVGYILTLTDGNRVYFAGDTGVFLDMQRFAREPISVAVLPIGDNFTMGPDESIEAIQLIRPAIVLPTHFNTWPVIAQDAAVWAERVRRETEARPVVLQPGETWICPETEASSAQQ